jgi:hypothetical protein
MGLRGEDTSGVLIPPNDRVCRPRAVCHQARLLQQNCHVSPLSLSSTAQDHAVK